MGGFFGPPSQKAQAGYMDVAVLTLDLGEGEDRNRHAHVAFSVVFHLGVRGTTTAVCRRWRCARRPRDGRRVAVQAQQ